MLIVDHAERHAVPTETPNDSQSMEVAADDYRADSVRGDLLIPVSEHVAQLGFPESTLIHFATWMR